MAVVQISQYESETLYEEEYDRINENKRTPKKRKTKLWIKQATFDGSGEAEASIKNEWSKHYTNYTESGKRVYYRCKKVKRRESQCSASIYLLYHADNDKVSIFKTEGHPDHLDEKVRGIDDQVKSCIQELYNDGVIKPKQIIRALQTRKMQTPTYTQLNNYLVYFKRKKYGSHKINLGELEQWCEDRVNIPNDENEAFVVSYKIMYDEEEEEYEDLEEDDGNKFLVFISSVRLLNIASTSSHICADATYKLIWQGFPILVIGKN